MICEVKTSGKPGHLMMFKMILMIVMIMIHLYHHLHHPHESYKSQAARLNLTLVNCFRFLVELQGFILNGR